MDRQSFTDLIQTKFKMVRIEVAILKIQWLKQSDFLKTLVQIEKKESYLTGRLVSQFARYLEIQMYSIAHLVATH